MSREVDYRFELLREGVKLKELHALSTASLSMQADAEITRSLSLSILEDADADWLTDRIRPVMYLNGQAFPLGVFAVSTATKQYDQNAVHENIEALDLAVLVKQARTEGLLHLNAGSLYMDAIKELLTGAGITSILADDAGDVFLYDREDWEEGTPYLTIINALLTEIAFEPLWFDDAGTARLERYREPSAENLDHVYRSGDESFIFASCEESTDLYNPSNVFKAVVSSAEMETAMTAVSVNDDPLSRISTVRLGRRILAPVVKLDSIASQQALQTYVDRMRMESRMATEEIVITTANMPGHGYHDTIALEHERLSGIYQEIGWSMALAVAGVMEHTCKRILYI